MKKYFIFITILTIHWAGGQDLNHKIQGLVLDQKDSSGLEFAHAYIKNGTIGTYTSTDGQFVLNYPDSLASDTLVISRIGYNTFMLPLAERDTSESLQIYLTESTDYLDEVVIYSVKDTVAAIVKKVLKRLRKNYPTKLHYLEGFYRELSLKGDTYTRLIEASVGVTENSYRKSETKSKVKIRQIRKSEDYRGYSLTKQLYIAAMKKMMKMAWGMTFYNNIYMLLRSNIAKMDRGNIVLFAQEKDFLEAFDFEVTKVSIENGMKLWHISFQTPPSMSSDVAHYAGEMVINMYDHAIVEWKFGAFRHPYKPIPSIDVMFYKGKFQFQHHIIYTKIEGKYYPTFFEIYQPILKAENHVYEDGREEYQFDKITLMVNRVVTNKKEFDRIKKREALEDELDLYDVDHPYDPEFWANYNILLLDPLLKPAKEDLEKEKPLETQFEENGE